MALEARNITHRDCMNRTMLELKSEKETLFLFSLEVYESNHVGIEIAKKFTNFKSMCKYESNHVGIEIWYYRFEEMELINV